MFAIKILKQEIEILKLKLKALTKLNYTTDPYANLEMNDLKMLIKDLENSILVLKENHLIK